MVSSPIVLDNYKKGVFAVVFSDRSIHGTACIIQSRYRIGVQFVVEDVVIVYDTLAAYQ